MLLNLLIRFVNLIISGASNLINNLIKILPESPFNVLDNINIPYLEYLNWVVPIGLFISILEVWLVAVGIYLTIKVALRWVKVIE